MLLLLTGSLHSGSSLITASTVLVFLATTWGGLTFPWVSPQVLSLLIIGGIGMLLFFVIERYWLKGPTVRILFPEMNKL